MAGDGARDYYGAHPRVSPPGGFTAATDASLYLACAREIDQHHHNRAHQQDMYYSAQGVTGEQSQQPQKNEYRSDAPHMILISASSNPLPAGAESARQQRFPGLLRHAPGAQSGLLFDRNVIFDIVHAIDRLGQFSGPVLLVFSVHEAA